MRAMKDSGIEWIGDIPVEWNLVKAKQVFKQSFSKGNDCLVLLSATQTEGVVPKETLKGVVQVKEDADLTSFKTVHNGDYVISLRSFQGGFELSNYEGVITPAYTVFRARKQIHNGYFKFLFKSDGFIAIINSLTTGIREGKNIQFDDVASILIPDIELAEQTAISDYLDNKTAQIDSIIEKQTMVIEKLKAYKQSVITEAVTKGLDPAAPMKDSGIEWIGKVPQGWHLRKLKTLLKDTIDNRGKTPPLSDSGIPMLEIDNLNGKDYSPTVESIGKFISQHTYENFLRDYLETGDILFATVGATIGKTAIVNGDTGYCIAQNIVGFRFRHNLCDPRFYLYYFMSDCFKRTYLMYNKGNIQDSIKVSNLTQGIVIHLPLSTQQCIAKYLDKKCSEIDKAIEQKQRLIDRLIAYKKSVIFEAVTGKAEV